MKKTKPVLSLLLFTLSSLLAAQSLTITAPNGGETLTLGQTVQITWTATNVSQKVKLQLIRGGGALVGLIAGNLNATPSSFTWTIGQTDSGTATADTNYKIRIRTMDSALEDASNATFTLAAASTPPPPPPASTSPYQRYQPELQKKPLTFNAQVIPYAVINSFTINGKVEVDNQRAECFRQQGLRFQVNTSSIAQPVSYHYTLRLLRPSDGMSLIIKQSPWLAQNDYTMQVTLEDIYDILYPEGNSNVPLSILGSVMVEVKNATQAQSPQYKQIQIKLTL
jgi:hypothetical protein